jgi:hypothetical protein
MRSVALWIAAISTVGVLPLITSPAEARRLN